jgi:CheY-like chemotaxis protein
MSSPRLSSAAASAPERFDQPSTAQNFSQPEPRKRQALVVDDAPDITYMLAVCLQSSGYEVTSAYSGSEALASAGERRYDIVVSDIGMPGMSGYDLARALRTMPGYGAVPLLAVTGFAMYDDDERARESGFDVLMTKPVNPLDFINRVRMMVH